MLKIHRNVALVIGLAFMASLARADAPARSAGTLHVLGIAVNVEGVGKPGPLLDSFNWSAEEKVKVLTALGKDLYRKVDGRSVLGADVTRDRFMGALNAIQRRSKAGDFVVLYIGMHGGTDRKDGWGVGTVDNQEIRGKEVKEILGAIPCPVLALIETCGSGGFARDHKNDIPVPDNVTVITCCRAKQSATNELDIAAMEALRGRADFNKDGVVMLPEFTRYVRLRFDATFEKDGVECVIANAKQPAEAALTRVADNAVAFVKDGEWYSGVLLGKEKEHYSVQPDGWNTTPRGGWFLTDHVTRDEIVLPGELRPLVVEQGGAWYSARLISMDGKNFKVKYVGYNEEETVTPDRVKYPIFLEPTGEAKKTRGRKAKN